MAQLHKATVDSDVQLPSPFIPGVFADDVWKLRIPARGGERTINWALVTLRDGSLLKSPRSLALLDGVKLYLLLCASGARGRPLRGGTLANELGDCLGLVSWMLERGIFRFADLSFEDVVTYRAFVERRLLTRSGPKRAAKQKVNKKLSPRSRARYLGVIRRMALLQEQMGELGSRFTSEEILQLEESLHVVVRDESTTKPIPDELFASVLRAATQWISEFLSAHTGVLSSRPPFRGCYAIARGAAFIVIASMAGMRESEICSLRPGCLRSRNIDGNNAVLELSGTLYKTSRAASGSPATWCAGYDMAENPVRNAVEMLERLPRQEGTALFSAHARHGQKQRDRVVKEIIRTAIRAFLEASGHSEAHIAPHQFRKTFARFVARSSAASPFTLMRHFKHVSVLMTERYLPALGADPELLQEVFDETRLFVQERLDDVFGSDRLGGLGGKRIVANNSQYRGEENAAARRRLIEMTMRDPSAVFRVTPLGLCIFDGAKAKCDGKVENIGIDVCVGCNNFSVDRENIPYWLEMRKSLESVILEQQAVGFSSIELHDKVNRATAIIEALVAENG